MSETDSIEWRWVDVDGSQSAVRFEQLKEALASGSLPPFTLVWRTGWTSWLSADRVLDLAAAFGAAHSAPLTVVRLTESALQPPAPPLERYRAVAPGQVGSLLRPRRAGAPSTVPPPPPPPRPGHRVPPPPPPQRLPVPGVAAAGAAGMPGIPGIPAAPLAPIPVRDVLPTLAGEELPVRSATLRPVGGMPPPPRTVPQPKIPSLDDDEGDEVSFVEDENAGEEDSADLEGIDAPPLGSPLASALKHRVPPQELTITQPSVQPAAASADGSDSADASRPSPVPRPARDLAGASRQTVTRATAIGVVLPGTLLLIAALVRLALKPAPGTEMPTIAPQTATPVAAAAPVTPATSAAAAPAVGTPIAAKSPSGEAGGAAAAKIGCSVEKTAARIAESAFVGVPVLTALSPDGSTLAAVGFAAAKDHARGITLDPESLQPSSVFDQTSAGSTTLGVVPITHGKALDFAVDRVLPKLASARTVDGAPRFTLGVTSEGLSRFVGPKMSVVWPGKSKNPVITTPRIASVPGLGHAVAFRHGGQEGKVLVGWLTENGTKQSELKAIGTDATLVGTPTISASETAVLVAFASKMAPEAGWRTELAAGPRGSIPERAVPMAVPPGGPGGETISPSSEVLPDGRFLVQWTEGSAGNRAVRAQVLSANLVPLGEPVTLSTPEQNAGQGALWVHGSQALALFLVKKDTTHELWGASLRCP